MFLTHFRRPIVTRSAERRRTGAPPMVIAAIAAGALSACSDTGVSPPVAVDAAQSTPGRDLAVPAPADLATVAEDFAPSYTAAKIHDIDVSPGNGPLGTGARVLLERVVAVSKVDKYVNSQNQQCRYQLWVQDPDCKVAPCGLVIKAIGPPAPRPDSTGKDCPTARLSGTLLANVGNGDNLRIRGKVQVEVDTAPPMTEVEHQVFIDTLEPLPNTAVITPLVFGDYTQYGQFVAHSGKGWAAYEGMLVTLAPAKGILQVTGVHADGFQTIPGPTDWSNVFDSEYEPDPGTQFPAFGSTFKSISGVVSTRHGGGIMPMRTKDFVP